MKIQELRLLAFGSFTQKTISLAGKPSFHVFYGLNEAGKSSTLRAIRAIFYGISNNTNDDFIHVKKEMRLGAHIIHSDGTSLEFVRRKGTKITLMDLAENPIDEAILNRYLGGISGEQFDMAFGLTHQSLVAGGRELLDGGGDVAGALFSAAMGNVSLLSILKDMEAEAADLFKSGASKGPVINRALSDITQYEKSIKAGSLSSKEWTEKESEFELALSTLVSIKTKIGVKQTEKTRLEKYQVILPKRQLLFSKMADLEQLGTFVSFPDDFGAKRAGIQQTLRTAHEAISGLEPDITSLTKSLETLTFKKEILEQSQAIDALLDGIGKYKKNIGDTKVLISDETSQIALAKASLQNLGLNISLEAAASKRPDSARKVRIQTLAGKYKSLQGDAERATTGIRATADKLRAEQTKLTALDNFHDTVFLGKGVTRIRALGDLEKLSSTEKHKLDESEATILASLSRLGMANSDLKVFVEQAFPSLAMVDQFETQLQVTKEALDTMTRSETALLQDIRDADRLLEEIQHGGGVPLESDLDQARATRQVGWELIRKAWEQSENVQIAAEQFAPGVKLADAYEAKVTESDSLADRLRREAERVSRRATQTALKTTKNQALIQVLEQKAIAVQEALRVQQAWEALWQPTGKEAQVPKVMRAWIQTVLTLQMKAAEHLSSLRDSSHKAEDIESHKQELTKLLLEAGFQKDPPFSLARLLDAAISWIDQQEGLKREHGRLGQLVEDLKAASLVCQSESDLAQLKLSDWKTAWGSEIIELGLESNSDPDLAMAILNEWEQFSKYSDAAAGMRKRITGIELEIGEFLAQVRAVADNLTEVFNESAPEAYAARKMEELAAAKQAKSEKETHYKQLEVSKRKLDSEKLKLKDASASLDKLCLQARCQIHDDLEKVEETSKHGKSLQEQINGIKSSILDLAGGASLEQVHHQAEALDSETLPQDLNVLEEDIGALESELGQCQENVGGLRAYLNADQSESTAIVASEKLQQTIAGAREQIDRYLRVNTALFLLKKEIERYREKNQNPILSRASQLYTRLTIGSYSGLRTDYGDDDKPILVGVRPDGKIVNMEGMSEGARDQVYLALRVATLEKHLEAGEPIPFVVDDILITFDEERAKATLEVLAELSQKTQILFFTHQARILELANGLTLPDSIKTHAMK